jgi:hypothetical protein
MVMSVNPFLFQSTNLWASHIAAQADMPDARLNTRFGIILQTFADKPLDPITQAAGDAGQAKAIYRFFANRRLEQDDLLNPIVDATTDACRNQGTILAIQDSSSTNYSSLLTTEDLGKLNGTEALGLHFHTTIAVQTNGVVAGMLHQAFWARPPEDEPHNGDQRKRAIEDKESYKWLEGIEAAEAAIDNGLPRVEQPRLLHIFDREGDIHEVLQRISDSPHGAIIRAAQNRSVAGEVNHAFEAVAAAPCIGIHRFEVSARHGAKKRQAQLELRTVALTITPSHNYPKRQAVRWTLVQACEINTPADAEPLHWLLWTNQPATTWAQIVEILRCYALRWRIEDFHLTLKSGCRVEKLQLKKADRLTKAIITYSAVALRIMALRELARQEPTASCERILNPDQWHALYAYFQGRQPTHDTPVPTIREAVKWIGRLGGHLGRKRDGMPGVRTLWRGWRDLSLLVAGYRAAQMNAMPASDSLLGVPSDVDPDP